MLLIVSKKRKILKFETMSMMNQKKLKKQIYLTKNLERVRNNLRGKIFSKD